MMTLEQPSNNNAIPIREFTALKQTNFFETLKQPRFSGKLTLVGPTGVRWQFYMYLGRLVYATGGTHPMRRWRRNTLHYLPNLPSHLATTGAEIANLSTEDSKQCWEYALLCMWVEQQKITLEQATKMIRTTITEVLFDVTQALQVTCELSQEKNLVTRLALIDSGEMIAESEKLWQAWQGAKIADRSPNMAPIITQPEQLQQRTKPEVFNTLNQLLDGQQTLRDLSIRTRKDVVTLTRSLLPYIQLGLVRLIDIPDLPAPRAIVPEIITSVQQQTILIACVDDSPTICQNMERMITANGYQFLGINDPLRAIALLLARKPDLIFMDLVMPNANGYELCAQLRKLHIFRHTPIIILTGNEGIIDRVRAKMVGASDYMTKPLEPQKLLLTVQRYLKVDTIA